MATEELKKEIERAGIAKAFLKGFREGVALLPLKEDTTQDYLNGYVCGKATMKNALNNYLRERDYGYVDERELLNLILKTN